jgi:hypothetical protein
MGNAWGWIRRDNRSPGGPVAWPLRVGLRTCGAIAMQAHGKKMLAYKDTINVSALGRNDEAA